MSHCSYNHALTIQTVQLFSHKAVGAKMQILQKPLRVLIATVFISSEIFAQNANLSKIDDKTKNLSCSNLEKRVKKLEKQLKNLKKRFIKVKTQTARDNLKWSVDFRTAVDRLSYTTTTGKKYKNDSLLSNRLWLSMAYTPSANIVFKGKLSFNKAYGATPLNYTNYAPQRGYGYDTFDWVLNENLLDDNIRLKEAYWLYMNDTFFGTNVNWSASFGRRPSTNGFLISLRDDDKPGSPLGHVINVEFDGASFKFGLERITKINGMYWKFCFGRGSTNARARFNTDGGFASKGDYSTDKTTLKDIDLAGFIFVPYNDGQYKIMTTFFRAFNVPGFNTATSAMFDTNELNTAMIALEDSDANGIYDTMVFNDKLGIRNVGDQDGGAISILIDGIGEGINDFLDDTKLFASFAWSKSNPNNNESSLDLLAMREEVAKIMGENPTLSQKDALETLLVNLNQNIAKILEQNPSLSKKQAIDTLMKKQGMAEVNGMLGSNDKKSGVSYYMGVQIPVLFTKDGRFGLEYNHGSKYWRPFTYAEDTLAGSKTAVRGDAIEAYYIQPITKGFSAEIRYTKLNYDYTGSQGFFGAGGAPMSMDEARKNGFDPIQKAQDIRLSMRYRF